MRRVCSGSLVFGEVLHRRDDRNPTKRMERKQIKIAGKDQIRPAIHSQLQKLIVSGMTASPDGNGRLEKRRNRKDSGERGFPHGNAYIFLKLWPADYFSYLCGNYL